MEASKNQSRRPAAKRQRLPAEERRQQIIDASRRVFVKQGFHGTRTRDLAKEAGVNEATLFLYFKSKQAIFDAAISQPLRQLVRLQMKEGQAFASASEPEQKHQIGFQGIKEMLEGLTEIAPLLLAALFADGDKGVELYRLEILPLIRGMTPAAKMSFQQDDQQGEFIALAAFGLCFLTHNHHAMLGKQVDIEEAAERISSLLMHGAFKTPSLPRE